MVATPELMSLCQVLSWIAFRKQHLVTNDPAELRRNMERYRKRVVEPNPAGDFLKMVRTGQITANAWRTDTGEHGPVAVAEWQRMSEAELWELVEFEWSRLKQMQ